MKKYGPQHEAAKSAGPRSEVASMRGDGHVPEGSKNNDIVLAEDPRWNEATRGDPAAAIAVAIRLYRSHDRGSAIDAAMAALAAFPSDAASRLVFNHLSIRLSQESSAKRKITNLVDAKQARMMDLGPGRAVTNPANPERRP